MNNIDIGARIKERREYRKLTQEDLAGRFGCSRETISNWERGERVIRAIDLARLAEILETNVVYFFRMGTGGLADNEEQADQVNEALEDLKQKIEETMEREIEAKRRAVGLPARTEENTETASV
jgi:transcriptional regulator with XRE-family HTH domain